MSISRCYIYKTLIFFQSQICCCRSFILVKTLRTKGVSKATTVESAPLAYPGLAQR